jgi:hypothetical protein
MGQSEQFHEQWAYLRDHAKPIVPDDVFDLRAVREFQPPSKAHLKRIARERPAVTPLRDRPKLSDGQRERINSALRYGHAVERFHRPNKFLPAQPLPYVRPAPIEPGAPRVAADHAERRNECLLREAARLASYGMVMKGPLYNMTDAMRAYRSIR